MIEPDFLDQLNRFESAIDRRVREQFQGEQRSTDVGEGLTFADHRKYVPGDDTRLIDWKLYGRTDQLYVKQYEAERNLTIHVLLDGSPSMDFGTENKFEYGAKIGLGFCYLTAKENNDFRFSLLGSTSNRIDRSASTAGEVLRLIDQLNDTTPEEQVRFDRALTDYAGTIDSKSLVVVISDFLADPDAVAEGIGALGDSDLSMIHLLAPEEVDPPVRGDTIFEGMELERRLRTYFGGRMADRYRTELEGHLDGIESIANETHTRYVRIDTGDDFFESFGEAWIG